MARRVNFIELSENENFKNVGDRAGREFFEKATTFLTPYRQGNSPAVWEIIIKDGEIINRKWIEAHDTTDFPYYKNGIFTYYLLDGLYQLKSTGGSYSFFAIIGGVIQSKTTKLEKLVKYMKKLY